MYDCQPCVCGDTVQDNETLEQIDRDVKRTHPDMHFFSGDDATAVRHRQVQRVWLQCLLAFRPPALLQRLSSGAIWD